MKKEKDEGEVGEEEEGKRREKEKKRKKKVKKKKKKKKKKTQINVFVSPRKVQACFSLRRGGFDAQVETESARDPLEARDTVSIVRVERARRLSVR